MAEMDSSKMLPNGTPVVITDPRLLQALDASEERFGKQSHTGKIVGVKWVSNWFGYKVRLDSGRMVPWALNPLLLEPIQTV